MDSSNNTIITSFLLIISILFVSTAAATVLDCGSCTPAAPSPKHKKKPSILPPTVLPVPPVTVPKLPVPLPPVDPNLPLPPVPKLPLPPVPKLPVPKLPLPPVPKLPLPPVPKLPLPPVPKLPVPLPPVTLPPVITNPPKGKGKAACPPPPGKGTCPIDTLKLGACVDLLGGLVHIGLGDPVVNKCCPLLSGLVEVEAAACLCTTLKLKALNLKLYVPIALQLLITCGKTPPPGYTCSL